MERNEQLFVIVLQLERVPGEVGDLIPVEGDDGFAGCGKAAVYGLALRRVVDHLQSDKHELRSDAQHDVGVINRAAVIAAALKVTGS